MTKSAEELQALCDRLKMEAQAHAQEARTANATIAEIYQLVTGKTGEPGNWHGAEPVRAALARIRADALEEAARKCDAAAKAVRQRALEPRNSQHAQIAIAMAQIPEECAAAIRALAEEPKG